MSTVRSPASEHLRVESVAQGAPLVLTFGFHTLEGPAAFEFEGRLKKLEQLSGRPLNKLFVRDPSMLWYLGGVNGIGRTVPEMVATLRGVIEELEPSAVITVGQSMGAYAAILFGTLLRADKVIAFGSLSCMDRSLWDAMGDARWGETLDELEALGVDFADHADLPRLLATADGPVPEIDLLFGRSAGERVPIYDAVGHDVVHAVRFAGLPTVNLLPVAHAGHTVVEYFRQRGVITEVLGQRIFGTSLQPLIDECAANDWISWILENWEGANTTGDLREIMLQQMPGSEAHALLCSAELVVDLGCLERTPPRVTA